jgi:ABC-type lipoprotein release transport system permease subunit
MSLLRLTLATLWFHWRTNLAVACGVAAGAAVLTGALLVGDSMWGSLRHLTLDRLGRIDEALVSDHFFRAVLADQLAAKPGSANGTASAAPAILLRVSLENADSQSPARAGRVELVGCDGRFWRLGFGGPRQLPQPHQIVLNQPLAERLGVRLGDAVLLRLPRIGAIPADSALGRKRQTVGTERLTVGDIIPAEGLGRFGLRPTQHLPLNAYAPLHWLQDRLEQPGRANAILVAGNGDTTAAGEQAAPRHWQPELADYGLKLEHAKLGYWNITSDRMLLDPATERAIMDVVASGPRPAAVQPALTYLANTLACKGREIPYSTITAIDFADRPPLGPFLSAEGKPLPPLGPNEIALNSWAADDLHAKLGDMIQLSFFQPESTDGQVRQQTVSLSLAAIVKLSGAAADRRLTPSVKGITDELTMARWDPPFPFDSKRIRPADEKYWSRYGPTPKAFVALTTGRRLWGSRFGQTTSMQVGESPLSLRERVRVRVGSERDVHASATGRNAPSPLAPLPKGEGSGTDVAQLLQRRLDPATMGLIFQPVRRQGLAAAAGTTPFGVLFLCFSFFLIAAAVMLVALLFRLGIEQRAAQIGTLLTIGFSRRQTTRLLQGEGLAVAALGSLVGVPLGIAYAAILLLGLRTWWLAAVATPFLRLYVTATSLAIGCLSGLLIGLAVIWLAVRRIGRLPLRRLLAGQPTAESFGGRDRGRPFWRKRWLELMLIVIAVGPSLALLGARLSEDVRAGAFFGSGALTLAALLALLAIRLKAGRAGPAVSAGGGNLARLALRNAARNPGRSTLTVGLVAAATFLIVALSAFQLDPRGQTPALHSGNGGFALAAESDQPILANLNSPEGRKDLGFSAEDERLLAGSTIVSLRVRAGEDASCLNLYRPRQPRVLGVGSALVDRDGFAWAEAPPDVVNPWQLLDQSPAPVILEKNTANYSLNLWGGLGQALEIADGRGRPLRLRVAALLADSIFQGDLLVSEREFLKRFPDTSGYRFFLVDSPPGKTAAVRNLLERNLGDYGFTAETTAERLADFLAVQNTYLSTFQSLGGLGLLLGTLGLAAVELRSVFERRSELALLRAVGFRRRRLASLVLLEHAVLLLAGLGIGVLAALLAVLPQLTTRAASLPWASLSGTLLAVLALGLAAGGLAVRAVLRAPLLLSLRQENL